MPLSTLEGVRNFRDLGNCCVKSGLIYRSMSFADATDSDLRAMRRANLRTVLDLRKSWERDDRPDRLPTGTVLKALDETVTPHPSKGPRDVDALCRGGPMARQLGNYRKMADCYTPMFGKALKLIADADAPLAFHCENGKDRAGMLAVLLYTLLDVPQELILADYLRSNVETAKQNEADLRAFARTPWEVDCLRALFEVRAEYPAAFFTRATEVYGSFERYAADGLCLQADDLARLRRRLLR